MRYHDPVLLDQAIEGLNIASDGTYVDVTFGGGGHSKEILKRLETGRLIAFDKDADAVRNSIIQDRDQFQFQLVTQDFKQMGNWLEQNNIGAIDGVLADLGISSHQIDSPERGFSIRYNSDLDMRMNTMEALRAMDVVNDYPESELARIFAEYGELRGSYKMARLIVSARVIKRIEKVDDLKLTIKSVTPKTGENKFLAKVFQALRIAVNDELSALKQLLQTSGEVMKSGARLVIISYHSLEDRLVKYYIERGGFDAEMVKDLYGNPQLIFKSINKKPIMADAEEVARNRRARSAKMRIAEKI
ncbi:MAG TPA: 16S rRNA (cytosine(1402)-N(4))-methyltransferase RsmH [Flavobacteriales bacterium]|nr:16S rRNA (cytosine(1402)-N(4))-methyltransferase RsmH [Flavobacteriales bacterium]HIA12811.1 16S rRNA (cytosine(1402)-N(4))-methyltransferase RsmH [Flavobacteriales bacterium]